MHATSIKTSKDIIVTAFTWFAEYTNHNSMIDKFTEQSNILPQKNKKTGITEVEEHTKIHTTHLDEPIHVVECRNEWGIATRLEKCAAGFSNVDDRLRLAKVVSL